MRATPYLDPKGRGNRSLVVKQDAVEGWYIVVLQALRNMAKAALPKF